MVREFESALVLHQQQTTTSSPSLEKGENYKLENIVLNGSSSVTLREKTFFEKQVSTVVMVSLSVVMVLLTCSLFLSSRPVKGSLFLVYSGYFSYATTWYINRKQRRN